jgi:hypothetical protein
MELSPVKWGELLLLLLLLQQVSFLKLKSPNLGLRRRKKDGFPEFDRLNSAAIEREAASSMVVGEEGEEPQNPDPIVLSTRVKARCSSLGLYESLQEQEE